MTAIASCPLLPTISLACDDSLVGGALRIRGERRTSRTCATAGRNVQRALLGWQTDIPRDVRGCIFERET